MRRRTLLAGCVATATAGCSKPAQTHYASLGTTDGARGAALTADMLEDALVGSSYLGCGGGGSLAEARELIASDLAVGHVFRSLPVQQLGDDERVACPYALASLAPMSAEFKQRLDTFEGREDEPVLASFRLLERHLGTSFAAVILGEIGPLSMAEGLSIAARLGVPALDADTVGRATPEINQHSVRVAGYPLTPSAGVTLFADSFVLEDVKDPARAEEIFRALSVTGRVVGITDAPITGVIAKTPGTLVQGSLSLCMAIGRAVREARAQGTDPISAARRAGNGYDLFTGSIETYNWADEDGFLVGDVTLRGTGVHQGEQMVLRYKNEHLFAARGGDVVATCPDLITVVSRETHEGINNPDFQNGAEVVVLGFKANPLWRTPAGLAVFAPRYFGYDVDYIPIEARLGQSKGL